MVMCEANCLQAEWGSLYIISGFVVYSNTHIYICVHLHTHIHNWKRKEFQSKVSPRRGLEGKTLFLGCLFSSQCSKKGWTLSIYHPPQPVSGPKANLSWLCQTPDLGIQVYRLLAQLYVCSCDIYNKDSSCLCIDWHIQMDPSDIKFMWNLQRKHRSFWNPSVERGLKGS